MENRNADAFVLQLLFPNYIVDIRHDYSDAFEYLIYLVSLTSKLCTLLRTRSYIYEPYQYIGTQYQSVTFLMQRGSDT